MRSDGKTFFATFRLPWIWDEYSDWRPTAKGRLDSFLGPPCECDARTEETKVCQFHLQLIAEWEKQDRAEDSVSRTDMPKLPPAKEGGGVYPTSKPMYPDYPWTRELPGFVWLCTICGFQEQGMYNPSYRNIFIRKHSHCGAGDGRQYEPKPIQRPALEAPRDLVAESGAWFNKPTAICCNCKKGIYQSGKSWFHLDLMAHCDNTGATWAQP